MYACAFMDEIKRNSYLNLLRRIGCSTLLQLSHNLKEDGPTASSSILILPKIYIMLRCINAA